MTAADSAPDPALSLAYYPYRYHIALRQSDGRGNGHVTNGTIATLGDDAREGVHGAIAGDIMLGRHYQIAESWFRFLHEVTYPGDLRVGVAITAIGNSSLRETLGFFREGRCYVLNRLVIVKTAGGRSSPMTPVERARAEAFLVPDPVPRA
ncbi:MAG: hypothetical protein ABW039_03350 [Sphingobium sp.]